MSKITCCYKKNIVLPDPAQDDRFFMLIKSPTQPSVNAVTGVTITITNLNNGWWTATYKGNKDYRVSFADVASSSDVTDIIVKKTVNMLDLYQFCCPNDFNGSHRMSSLKTVQFTDTCSVYTGKDMRFAFLYTYNLESVDFTGLQGAAYEEFNATFRQSGIEFVDLSFINTTKFNAVEMFRGCSNLKYVKMPGDMQTAKPTGSLYEFFYDCTNLRCLDQVNTTNSDSTSAMFYNSKGNLTGPTSSQATDIENGTIKSYTNPNACPPN
jgi:hypothetical protein